MLLFAKAALLSALMITMSWADNSTRDDSECILTDVETRLDIAAQIIETVRQKIPRDLKELCKRTFNITESKDFNITDCKKDCNITDCKKDCNITDCKKNCNITDCKKDCNITDCKKDCNITDCKEVFNITDCKEVFNITDCKNITHYVKPVDCSDIYQDGERRDGVYEIWPQSRLSKGPLKVYCDMESNGGGWTVVQRRGDFKSPEDYFYKDWEAYKTGFGDILKDFWIGNDNLFVLTNQRSYQLRVNLSDWEGNSAYAIYDEFWVADELHNYTLHIEGYGGTAGDSLSYHNRRGFFTKDRDNPNNCAVQRKGGFWYENCFQCNLNGLYLRGTVKSKDTYGCCWRTFRDFRYSLKDIIMKVRPFGFSAKPVV